MTNDRSARSDQLHDRNGKSVGVIGAGGNIGSHFIPHLGRMPGVTRALLVDGDHYEQKNLRSQNVVPADVGRAKAIVQRRKLLHINPQLAVEAKAVLVQDIPAGLLACDALVACLDSRVARQYVNEISRRLGIPWIDTGVDADGLLAQVQVYLPNAEAACIECAWNADDYAALEQVFACQDGSLAVAPTNAPSSLGAIAAGVAAIECEKLLNGDWHHLAHGREILIDLRHHTHFVTSYRRNANCRFDHATWNIALREEPLSRLTLDDLRGATGSEFASADNAAVRAFGQSFVTGRVCQHCMGRVTDDLLLARHSSHSRTSCSQCGGKLVATGLDTIDWVRIDDLTSDQRQRSLRKIGLRQGDIVTIRQRGAEQHVLLAGG